MSKAGDDRGQGVQPPEWWLKLFRAEYERRQARNADAKLLKQPLPFPDEGRERLGIKLAELAGRSKPWNHSAVTNFINDGRYTREMAEAFSFHYDLPRFEVLLQAKNELEAWKIESFAGRQPKRLNPDPTPRLASIDQLAATLREDAEDQIAPVKSSDERTNRGGRARRSARRS